MQASEEIAYSCIRTCFFHVRWLMQCCIDLRKGVLRVGTTGTEVPFLSEGNLPRSARLARLSSSSSATQDTQEEDRQLAEALTRSQTDPESSDVVDASRGRGSGDTSGDPAVSEAAVQEIMASGFTREEAIAELRQASGDMALALARLIARSFKF